MPVSTGSISAYNAVLNSTLVIVIHRACHYQETSYLPASAFTKSCQLKGGSFNSVECNRSVLKIKLKLCRCRSLNPGKPVLRPSRIWANDDNMARQSILRTATHYSDQSRLNGSASDERITGNRLMHKAVQQLLRTAQKTEGVS